MISRIPRKGLFLSLGLWAFVAGCGRDASSGAALEGDWKLTSAVWNGENRSVNPDKAYVYRFRAGRYSVPVLGGLPADLAPPSPVPYERDGSLVRIHDGTSDIELTIVELNDTTLVLQPKTQRMTAPQLTFTRIASEVADPTK